MNDEDLKKELVREIIIQVTPIDFDKLIKDGVIKKIGKSYYTDSIRKLPADVAKKINFNSLGTKTKNGIRFSFYKDTSTKKATEDLKKLGYSEKSIKEMIQKQKRIGH